MEIIMRLEEVPADLMKYFEPVPKEQCDTVWPISSVPFHGAHFAAFPPELVEKCILAGTSAYGVCGARDAVSGTMCGAPWERVLEKTRESSWEARKAAGHTSSIGGSSALQIANGASHDFDNRAGGFGTPATYRTTGWQPTCRCACEEVRPAICFDPFVGTGTTLQVARQHGRHGLGTDLSWAYLYRAARERLGLAQLAAWQGKPDAPVPLTYADLPLFALE